MEKYANYLNEYKDKRDQLKARFNYDLSLYAKCEELAKAGGEIDRLIRAFNGKVYNKRFDDQLKAIADRQNEALRPYQLSGRVSITAKRKKRYYDGRPILEIEIRVFTGRANYTDYVSYWLTVELTDYERGRIISPTYNVEPVNQRNMDDLAQALAQVDPAADALANLLQAIENFTKATNYNVRRHIRLPLIIGVQQ
jgi:hypothetical protein